MSAGTAQVTEDLARPMITSDNAMTDDRGPSVDKYVQLYIEGVAWDHPTMSLSEQDRAELQAVLRSEVYDGSVSSRAQIVLWHDEGRRKGEIAKMSGASRVTVDKWLARYEKFGMDGLVSRTSPGGPRQIPDRIRARVLALTRTGSSLFPVGYLA